MRIGKSVIPGWMERGAGRPLVMIPGMEGSREFWRPQMEELGRRYRVICCDLPRFSPRLSRTVADYAEAVIRLMDRLGLAKAALAGESFGGMVAQELAIYHAGRVSALILCNTMDRVRRGGFGFNRFTLATLAHFSALLPGLSEEARRKIMAWTGRHRGFIMDPSPGNERLARYLAEHGADQGIGCLLDRIIAGARAAYTEKLNEIRVPTLVIRGTEDCLVVADTTLQLVGGISGAELALIKGGGHCCTYTMPDESNRAILEWLRKIDY